jgi:hypothetical protein
MPSGDRSDTIYSHAVALEFIADRARPETVEPAADLPRDWSDAYDQAASQDQSLLRRQREGGQASDFIKRAY